MLTLFKKNFQYEITFRYIIKILFSFKVKLYKFYLAIYFKIFLCKGILKPEGAYYKFLSIPNLNSTLATIAKAYSICFT